MRNKIAVASGIVVGGLPLVSMAAAPTSFSTTTAVSVLDAGYDTFISVVTGITPVLLPVMATIAFVMLVWRLAKRYTHFR